MLIWSGKNYGHGQGKSENLILHKEWEPCICLRTKKYSYSRRKYAILHIANKNGEDLSCRECLDHGSITAQVLTTIASTAA